MRRILSLLLFVAFFSVSLPTWAFDPEFDWRVDGHNPPIFQKKADAVAYMRSLTSVDPRFALLTIERRIAQVTDREEIYVYEAPKLESIPQPWRYFDDLWGAPDPPGYLSEEADWVADRLARTPSAPECPQATLTPTGDWYVISGGGWGGKSTREGRGYQRTHYSYPSANNCVVHTDSLLAVRDRLVLCPSGYSGEQAAPGCYLPFSARIIGRPLYCEGSADTGTRANPCNALTGDKSETVRDYSGPYGLVFDRYYHSKSLDATNGMGVGWSHNYQGRLIISNGGTLYGVIRPNGYRVESQGHLTANGLIIRQSGSSWKVIQSDGTVEWYDSGGRLASIERPVGGTTTLAYTGNDLSTVTGPFGHKLEFQYDSSGRLARVLTPSSQAVEFGYTGDNLTSVSYPDGTSRTYHYEDTSLPNNLTGITDENGARFATFSYDSIGRALMSEHAGGVERYSFQYNAANTVVTDPLGTQETISFTTDWWLPRRITQTNKGGRTYSYNVTPRWIDFQRRIEQQTDARGLTTKFAYSGEHLTSRTEAFGTPKERTITYSYLDADTDLPTLITEPHRTTAFTYNSARNVLTKTVTDTAAVPNVSRTWSYTYDSSGRMLTEDGPRTDVSDITTYTYYSCTAGFQCGRVHTITNALGHVTTFNTYNAHGQPLTMTDLNGVVIALAYDLRQRLVSRQVGSEITAFEYWPTGLLKRTILPDSSYLLYTYDDAHRLLKIEDGIGSRIDYTLDPMGNRTAENAYDPSNALSRTRTWVFNSLNQLWKQVGSAGTAAVTTTFGYDGNDNQTSVVAPLGRNTTRQYDELNRLEQINDPAAGATVFAYDELDNLTSVTDPRGNVTGYTYTAFGEVKQITSPDTGATDKTYDSAGNISTTTDARGKTGTYSYDELNRVTSVAYPDRTTSFSYDAGTNGVGRLTGASDVDHSLAWIYDAQGRVTGKSQTVGTVTKSVAYGYTNGNLTSLTTPSGQTITFGYTNGRVTSAVLNGGTTILDQVLYEPFGPVRQWAWGNATLANRVYDLDGNPSAIDSEGATTYLVDDAFRIAGITDLSDSSRSWSYGYDLLDRLTSAARSGQTMGFSYDANGNRLTQTGTAPAAYSIAAANNRVTSITGSPARTYTYDAAGNTTGYGGLTFEYQDSRRLRSATAGGLATSYTLNALGQRVGKASSVGTRLFMYDEAGHLLGEYDGTGALVQETVWMDDIPVATLRPNGASVSVYYVHTDHLNTPRRLSRPGDNAVVWRWDSDPFGTDAANEDPDGDTVSVEYNLRFPGQYYDAESGLNYNYMRDYDPYTGRYLESDPIGLAGGSNTYVYAANDPAEFIDPLGLAERGGGQKGLGGNDPLIPKNINKTTPKAQVDAAVKALEETIKKMPGINPDRLKVLKAWIKVAKRGWTKALDCPPLLDNLVKETLRQMCGAGDVQSCKTFRDFYPDDFAEDFTFGPIA